MYQQGFAIKISGDNPRTQILPKQDFAGDKPWTHSIWSEIIEYLKEIEINSYPLFISDLDNPNSEVFTLNDKIELEDWIGEIFNFKK
jgi:L-rhamnose mutarotase